VGERGRCEREGRFDDQSSVMTTPNTDDSQKLVPGTFTHYVVIGGAGFIGAHFVDRLLGDPRIERVTIFDNFSSGREWHLAPHLADPRFRIVRGDVGDLESLTDAVSGHQVAIHLASNPDIALAATEPAVDFDQGTALTHHVVEAARRAQVVQVLYASGSGVYGDLHDVEAYEDFGPLVPVSTYGASKLAGEALFASYSAMFGLTSRAFRFANVVGPRQTHGVAFDFLLRLRDDSTQLRILGDGTQSKSYIHVFDVIDAVLTASVACTAAYEVFNVATGDYVTVREIADLVVGILSLNPADVEYKFSGGDRGWKGDVPIVRLNTDRIRSLGWSNRWSSAQALERAIRAMNVDAEAGLFS
jgi:UDP-glucose 4-epimerase